MITIKTSEEVVKMKQSGKILASTLKYIADYIKPGQKTITLDKLAEDYILEQGGIPSFKGYRGYRHSTCLSINEQVVHGIPSERELLPGDIIGVDIGVLKDGFHSDMAYTFPVGEISQGKQALLEATQEALLLGEQAIKAGVKLGAISNAIENVAKKYNYAVVRDLFGHGIGRDLHEDPLIPNFGPSNQGPELKEGMTLAIEPMFNCGTYKIVTLEDGWTVVTKDAKMSAHFEHTVLVTKDGYEVITKL
ncbi:MAG: type I methionyl aminopeptidase [Candidatus Margulisbacteria bacterium]|nr:type I methionyl aminopeptidase [Candidatus Margulisiibacteriota bacterium]